jgi:DNA-directed RNA polymerase specialized sigma24 family protein
MTESLHAVPQHVREADAAASEDAFETFFDTERVRLLGALIVMTGNRAEAEELLQDAFLKVWERWDRVAAMENPTGYLYRTALNLHRRRLRRASVAMRRALNILPNTDELAGVEVRDEAVRLLGKLTPRERGAIVAPALARFERCAPTRRAARNEADRYDRGLRRDGLLGLAVTTAPNRLDALRCAPCRVRVEWSPRRLSRR